VKRRIRMVVGLAAIGLIVTACSSGSSTSTSASPAKETTPIKVAIVEPFSGPFGYFGDFLKNSLQYQADKINASGGLLGRQIEIITRDDQISSEPTVAAVRELSDDASVGLVVGPSFSFLYNAARPIYEAKMKLNCPLSVDATNAVQGAKYTFRAGPYNELSDNALLNYFKTSGTVKTIGLVYSQDATGQSLDTELKGLASKYGVTYLGAQFYNAGAANQLAQFNALKKADAIFISSDGSVAAQSAISASEVGYKGILVGNDGLQSYQFVDGAGDHAAGSVFASEPLLNMTQIPQTEWPVAYRDFMNAATAKYGVKTGPKSGVTQLKATPLATQCIVAWAAAVQKAGTFDSTKVAQAWESLSIPASQNPAAIALAFSAANHDFFRSVDQMAVYQWVHENGKWFLKTLQKNTQ